MHTISAFADEISPHLAVQIAELKRHGLHGLDLRSVEGVNVLDLTDTQLKEVRTQCADVELKVQAIGSPVNKVPFSQRAREEENEKLRRAIHAAEMTGTKRIRIFSPEGAGDLAKEDEAVIDWLTEQRDIAQGAGMILLHENDAKFWGAYPENSKKLFAALGNDHFKAAFDFANTILLGFNPWQDWFPWIIPYLDTLHIKDAIKEEGRVVPAGQGEGNIAAILMVLQQVRWQGTLTLEPHLAATGPFGGFSGEQLFEEAVNALRLVLLEFN